LTTDAPTTTPRTRAHGRPPGGNAYRAEYGYIAETAAAELNATDAQLARLFSVGRRTIANWKKRHKDFDEALKRGKEEADEKVKKALFQRATGYNYQERKVVSGADGGQEVTEYERHAPPDVNAALKWLYNRQPSKWKATPVEVDDDTPTPTKIIIYSKDCSLHGDSETGELGNPSPETP